MILKRPRVTERLATAAVLPVTLLTAPAGYGKSVALDGYVDGLTDAVRFDVRRSHASLARFVRAFAAALEPSLPRIGQSLAIAYERARQAADASDVLANWLAEHLEGQARTVVIDDLHHCEGERAIAALLAGTIERTRDNVRWILATRSNVDLPYATWFARGDTGIPIDELDLRATASETRDLANVLWPGAGADRIARLAAATDGSLGVFGFALATIAQDPLSAERLLNAGGDPFERFAGEVLERFTPADRTMLVESAAFPEIDEALISTQGASTAAFAAIAVSAPQIFENRDGRRHFHGLFASLLLGRLRELGTVAMREASLRAAIALERSGRTPEALATHIRDRHDSELVRFIEAHGFVFLEAGHGESIHEAIEALDPLVQTTSPSVLAIKAMSESTIGRFDTAESWFQLALDRASGPLRFQIAYQYGSHLLRFFRIEAANVFEEIAANADVPEKLRAYVLAALGPAYVFEHRLADARDVTDRGLELAKSLDKPHVLAKAHHQAAFVALQAGDAHRAKDLASTSLEIATEHGFYDVAAGALSVLYNVASDIDDDPAETVRLLEAMGDCAAKSGSLINQLISLVAILEIEIEAGNEDAASRIEAKLRTLDVTFAGRTTYEALLPSRALRASWSGDFLGAYRLLAGSAAQQWNGDRKALRYAEIAVYAAAAGLRSEASDAILAAGEILENIGDPDLRVQRANLMLALGASLLGHSEDASKILARIDAAPTPISRRLRALRAAIGAVHLRYRGERNQNAVLEILGALAACGFGGVGRLITMLPLSDNASHRAHRLNSRERALVLRLADGEPAAERDVSSIVAKLGCADREAVIRAVTWHRSAFERAARDAVREEGVG